MFWTENSTELEVFFGMLIDSAAAAEDEELKPKLHAILSKIAKGSAVPELGDAKTPFYVLGLSPNAARISVRFWHESTLGDMIEKLRQHFADLALVHADWEPDFPAVWQLLRQTGRESKDIPPLLAGALMRAILTGGLYPAALYAAVLRRIRADRNVSYLRVAVIKASLQRDSRNQVRSLEKELSMALDEDRPEPAYHLGRLFAELERTQLDANRDEKGNVSLNTTIRDRFFSTASTSPRAVFVTLLRMHQHHLRKLDSIGSRIWHENRVQEIVGKVNNIPPRLDLQQQGLFALGYYHQRQDIFTSKSEANQQEEVLA